MSISTGSEQQTRIGGADPRPALHRMLDRTASGLGSVWTRHEVVLGILVLWGFAASILAIGWLRPDYDWDMVAYLAVAFQNSFSSAAELHAHVWALMQAGTESGQFAALSEGDGFRLRQFQDPNAFASMLGMYEVKWLYVALLGAVLPVSGAMAAPFVINAGALTLLFGVMTWWLASERLLGFAPVVVAALLVAQFPGMVLAENPDLLTCALVLSGFLLLDRDRQFAGCLALVLAAAVRPDSAAVVGVLMAAAWFWRDRLSRTATAAFVLSVAVYLAVSLSSSHPGWWAHVWFSTYQFQETMEGFAPQFSLFVYAAGFAWNLVRSAFENTWLGLYAGMLFMLALAYAGGWRFSTRRTVLVAAALLAVAAKYTIFPLHEGRTYLPLLLPALLIAMAEARRLLGNPEIARSIRA